MDSDHPLSQSTNFVQLLNSQNDNVYPETFSYPSIPLGSSQVPVFSSEVSPARNLCEDTATTRKERRKWTPADDVLLISAWLNTSKDAVIGNEQKARTFWKRVAEYFSASPRAVNHEKREPSHCKQRWAKINDLVGKFCGAYAAAERGKSSGQNDNDVLKSAHQIFYNNYNSKFTLEHAWKELRNDQKWCSLYSSKGEGSNKRRNIEEGAQSSASQTNNEHQSIRPPGVKASKAKKSSQADGKCLREFQSMWAIKEQDLLMKEKLSKMALLDSFIARKDTLSELEEDLKQKLLADLLANY